MRNLELIRNQGLQNRVAIYIPSTINVNETIDNTIYVEKCAVLLSELFDGCTSQEVNGYWNSKEYGLVKESVTIVYSFASELTDSSLNELLDFCDMLKTELNQEAISFEYNGRLMFV